jgi:hypothetical protein
MNAAAKAIAGSVAVDLNAVIVAVTDEVPRILTVRRTPDSLGLEGALAGTATPRDGRLEALPFGPLDPGADRTLELALRGWVRRQTGLELGYVEQLYTFGDRSRGAEDGGAPRVVSIAYLALVRESRPTGGTGGEARWRDVYRFFPWEDWREGRPSLLDEVIVPRLNQWIEEASGVGLQRSRRERADIVFGQHGTPWDGDRCLERYELLYEVGLVEEAHRDVGERESQSTSPGAGLGPGLGSGLGKAMALDHRRILATALGRLRGKIQYRPVVFEVLPPTFTLLQLQRTVEALAGVRLHKQNFRRLVEKGGLVDGTGKVTGTRGRPAELFTFRRDVLRERPAPGVGLPESRSAMLRPS